MRCASCLVRAGDCVDVVGVPLLFWLSSASLAFLVVLHYCCRYPPTLKERPHNLRRPAACRQPDPGKLVGCKHSRGKFFIVMTLSCSVFPRKVVRFSRRILPTHKIFAGMGMRGVFVSRRANLPRPSRTGASTTYKMIQQGLAWSSSATCLPMDYIADRCSGLPSLSVSLSERKEPRCLGRPPLPLSSNEAPTTRCILYYPPETSLPFITLLSIKYLVTPHRHVFPAVVPPGNHIMGSFPPPRRNISSVL